MLNYRIKIGLAPMRRDVTPRPGIFNWEKAEERGHAIVDYIEKHFVSENVSFVDLKVIHTEPGFKGDTASNTTKPATVETGYTLNVPLFVEIGDVLRIDTSEGTIEDLTTGDTFKAHPLPGFVQDIAKAGGLIPYIKEKRK